MRNRLESQLIKKEHEEVFFFLFIEFQSQNLKSKDSFIIIKKIIHRF